ncbi:hypothetical protein CW304_33075 [Bacillus sp. UFRGS-B20]|nr:hypothetical protein CW304_33075 [Bacillus sp. UFRGS-B20]
MLTRLTRLSSSCTALRSKITLDFSTSPDGESHGLYLVLTAGGWIFPGYGPLPDRAIQLLP